MLWRRLTNAIIEKQLLFKKNAVMRVTSTAGVETDLDPAELAALQDMSATDLQKIDGITNGTAAANKAVFSGPARKSPPSRRRQSPR